MSVCDRFPNLTPLEIRRERFGEVFLLVRRLNEYSANEQKREKQKTRRPAGDNWF